MGKNINECHVLRVVKDSERILQVNGKMEKRKKLQSEVMVRFMAE